MSHYSEKFRHVMFADAMRGSTRAINFAFGRSLPSLPDDSGILLHPEEDALIRWLFRQANLNSHLYREETLRRRLPAVLRFLQAGSISQARLHLRQQPSCIPLVLSIMLIGVTSFFRDERVFAYIRNQVLPNRLSRSFRPRILSIGCSDGSELYSIAIALAEVGSLEHCELVGTDCRSEAIARARAGVYDESELRSLPADLAVRYFRPSQRGWTLNQEVRSRVRWKTSDILATIEPGPWDLILCRNVVMYMKSSATQPLWQRLQSALVRDGYLILGKAERPVGAEFLSGVEPCIFRRDRG